VLRGGGQPIDLVYRRVLINDIIARADECSALGEGLPSGAVCVANTLRCKLPHKKAFFAVLTDPAFAGFQDAADQAIVRAHVPMDEAGRRRADRSDGAAARASSRWRGATGDSWC
jgi:hypothetical protein